MTVPVNSCQDMKMVKVCVTDILNEDDSMKLGDLRQQVQLKLFGKFSCDIRTLNAYVDSTVAHLKRKQAASDPPSKRASPKPIFMRRWKSRCVCVCGAGAGAVLAQYTL